MKWGGVTQGIEIWLKLKESLDRFYFNEAEKVKAYCMVVYNLSTFMGRSERYKEALEMCVQGLAFCKKHREAYFPPLLWFNKACDLFYEGETERCKEAFSRAFSLFYGRKERMN